MLLPGMRQTAPAKGLCRGHYEQQRSKRSLQPLPSRRRGDPACSFEGCGNVAVNRGLCQAHANQRKKGQSLRPSGPSTARRVRADSTAASNLVWLEASAQGTPPSTTVAARWLRASDLIDAAVRVLKLYQPDLLNTHALDNWEKDAGDTPRLN